MAHFLKTRQSFYSLNLSQGVRFEFSNWPRTVRRFGNMNRH